MGQGSSHPMGLFGTMPAYSRHSSEDTMQPKLGTHGTGTELWMQPNDHIPTPPTPAQFHPPALPPPRTTFAPVAFGWHKGGSPPVLSGQCYS